jgi:hypothetical protein
VVYDPEQISLEQMEERLKASGTYRGTLIPETSP